MGKSNLFSSLVLGACFFLSSSSLVNAARCNADNCLRALFPTPSPSIYSFDASVCATYVATVNTVATGFASRASAACGTAPARYSSACSCRPPILSTMTTKTTTTTTPTATTVTCPPTPTNNIVRNGGFECGLAPWIAADIPNSQHSLVSPGDASNFAYEYAQLGPVTDDNYQRPGSVNQDLPVTVNQAYVLKFRTYFDKCTPSEGFVGVMLNHQPVYTVDACDFGAGAFKDNTVYFTPTVSPFNLRFEFIIAENPAQARVDNVVVVPV